LKSAADGADVAGDFDTFDVARIEVLRGPQGTLYGASSLGGVFKFITTLPTTKAVEARFLEAKDGAIAERSLPVRLGDVEYHALTGQYGCRLARCGQAEHTGPGAASLAQVLDWLRRHGITELIGQRLVELLKANLVDERMPVVATSD
jgi:hypothetical protein